MDKSISGFLIGFGLALTILSGFIFFQYSGIREDLLDAEIYANDFYNYTHSGQYQKDLEFSAKLVEITNSASNLPIIGDSIKSANIPENMLKFDYLLTRSKSASESTLPIIRQTNALLNVLPYMAALGVILIIAGAFFLMKK